MQMNPATRPEVLRDADQVKEPCGMPGGDLVPQKLCTNEEAPLRPSVGSHVPDERASRTFVGGAGI